MTSIRLRATAPVVLFSALYALDTLAMVVWWQHESNPLLLDAGLGGAVAIKIGVFCGVMVAWWPVMQSRDHSIVRAVEWAPAAIYGFVAVTNLWFLAVVA